MASFITSLHQLALPLLCVLSQSGLSKQQEPVALFEFSFISEGVGMGEAAGTGDSSNSIGNSSGGIDSRTSLTANLTDNDNCVSGASSIGDHNRPVIGDRVVDDKTKKKTQTMCVEYCHSELYAFFDQLERIQHQLDALA